jgi:hypothetical protein
MASTLTTPQLNKLRDLVLALIDQEKARILVAPNRPSSGFWFGGGGLARGADGTLYLCGRYRNFGDSRTGLAAGERGLECAVFASKDNGASFSKVASWSKSDLSYPGGKVLSFEGTSLHQCADGSWELFVSSEKERPYPDVVKDHLKPGAGVWNVDVITGPTPEQLDGSTIRPVLEEREDAAYIHIKDPAVYDAADGATEMIFCSHPFCWSSANSGLARREPGEDTFRVVTYQMVERGPAWDVAGTRATCRMRVPRVGEFAEAPPSSILFYDGLECVREHEQNTRGVQRPRGYSCEEISGVMAGPDDGYPGSLRRISWLHPLFISPWGTGCSRYVDVLAWDEGLFATWQQSQDDLSQALVGHFLPMADVERILS